MSDVYPHAKPLPSAAAPWKGWLAAFALLAISPAAHAANSPIGPSSGQGELTQSQILEHLYGGSFAQNGDDFSNGSVQVRRIDDDAGAEQIFQADLISARAVAAFSRNTEATVGTVTGGEFEPLLNTSGKGLDVSGSADLSGQGLRNAILALKSGGKVYESTGASGTDPLITYSVSGLPENGRAFVLFWEDAKAPYADFDYNDLVVEVAAADGSGPSGSNVLIPLPAAAWTGLSLMGGVSLMAGLRKLRQRIRG